MRLVAGEGGRPQPPKRGNTFAQSVYGDRRSIGPIAAWLLIGLSTLVAFLTVEFSGNGVEACNGTIEERASAEIPQFFAGSTVVLVFASLLIAATLPTVIPRIATGLEHVRARSGLSGLLARSALRITGVFWNFASWVLSAVDYLLVHWVARLAGATHHNFYRRYAHLLAIFVPSAGAAWLLPIDRSLSSIVALSLSCLPMVLVLAIVRRWSWIEEDRREYQLFQEHEAKTWRIGFGEDLTDEALVALASLMIFIPLALSRAHDLAQDAFCVPATSGFVDWGLFFGGELAKAIPFVDWAEVFKVENASDIAPASAFGAQLVFGLRAALDLVLLAALLEVFGILGRVFSQAEAFYGKPQLAQVLDPFDERRRFRALSNEAKEDDWTLQTEMPAIAAFPRYSEQVLETRLLGRKREARAADGAISASDVDLPPDSDPKVRLAALLLLLKQTQADISPETLGRLCLRAEETPFIRRVAFAALLNAKTDCAYQKAFDVAARLGVLSSRANEPVEHYAALLPIMPRLIATKLGFGLGVLPQMSTIPGGSYTIGASEDDPDAHPDERGQTEVLLEAFRIGTCPVSESEWRVIELRTKKQNPAASDWETMASSFVDLKPKTNIRFEDAAQYCQDLNEWLNQLTGNARSFTLPTEARWEAACRHSINTAAADPAASGLPHNMLSEHWEWCLDRYRPYRPQMDGRKRDWVGVPADGSPRPGRSRRRVLRGGQKRSASPAKITDRLVIPRAGPRPPKKVLDEKTGPKIIADSVKTIRERGSTKRWNHRRISENLRLLQTTLRIVVSEID